jgi:very-short-patch-repair endonuclease
MKILKDNSKLETARRLRREMTPHERKLWYLFLRTYPVKIYKQRIIDRYIADFYCASARLVIEVDGSQHFDSQGMVSDAERTAVLESFGLKVIRYSNREIDREFSAVCDQIDRIIQERTLSAASGGTSPKGRGK